MSFNQNVNMEHTTLNEFYKFKITFTMLLIYNKNNLKT